MNKRGINGLTFLILQIRLLVTYNKLSECFFHIVCFRSGVCLNLKRIQLINNKSARELYLKVVAQDSDHLGIRKYLIGSPTSTHHQRHPHTDKISALVRYQNYGVREGNAFGIASKVAML